MRALSLLPLVFGLAAVPGHAIADGFASAPDPRPAADAVPLPAGVYWHSRAFSGCDWADCPEPAAAVVAGGPTAVDAAVRRSRRFEGRGLAAGYPWLAHSDELGTPRRAGTGVFVILALFEDAGSARAYVRSHPVARTARVVAVSDPAEHYEESRHPRQVIRIGASAAEAFARAPVDRIAREIGTGPDGVRAMQSQLRPVCRVAAGAAIVSSFPYGAGDAWVPFTCGRRPVYVRLTDTLFRAVVRTTEDGPVLSQVTAVECDSANIDTWRYEGGRRVEIAGEPYLRHPLDVDPEEAGGFGCGLY